MKNPAKIAFVCEGDAESADSAFSGSAKSVVDHLRALGHTVTTIDSEIHGVRRIATAARCFTVDRNEWRARFHFGPHGYRARTRQAALGFAALKDQVDVIFQIGATFEPPGRGVVPYVLHCDWNMACTIRHKESDLSAAHHMNEAMATELNAREAQVYRGAAAVFTFSERLRQSFIEDYGLPPDQVVTAHPGPNFDISELPPRPARLESQPPTIVFVGRDFTRKGGETLLRAFQIVRERIPDVRLRIIGPDNLQIDVPGVEVLGLLRKSVPGEFEQLIQAQLTADVFCLPTCLEPFGMAVLEAMVFELPCITSDIWAMPEMVVDGETGYTVSADDAAGLAERLGRLLSDPELARRFGKVGKQRLLEKFSWASAAAKMHQRIQALALSD